MSICYFFDLPVYRLPREQYYTACKAHVDRIIFQVGTDLEPDLRKRDEEDPHRNILRREMYSTAYGGCWEFNEIVGYIRLHFLGMQVRGEYYASYKKQAVRTRTKQFEFKTHKLAPEVDIDPPYQGPEIIRAVQEYIQQCRCELPQRHIDVTGFDRLAPYLDWVALLHGTLPPPTTE